MALFVGVSMCFFSCGFSVPWYSFVPRLGVYIFILVSWFVLFCIVSAWLYIFIVFSSSVCLGVFGFSFIGVISAVIVASPLLSVVASAMFMYLSCIVSSSWNTILAPGYTCVVSGVIIPVCAVWLSIWSLYTLKCIVIVFACVIPIVPSSIVPPSIIFSSCFLIFLVFLSCGVYILFFLLLLLFL